MMKVLLFSQCQWGSQCLSSDSETAGAVKHYERHQRTYLSKYYMTQRRSLTERNAKQMDYIFI